MRASIEAHRPPIREADVRHLLHLDLDEDEVAIIKYVDGGLHLEVEATIEGLRALFHALEAWGFGNRP